MDVKALQIENQRLRAKIAYLEAQVGEYRRMVHGSKRERFVPVVSAEQLSLFGKLKKSSEPEKEGLVPASQQRKRPGRKEKPSRKVLPDHFPREEIIIEPDFDTTGLVKIGKEVTEELEFIPAFFKIYCYIRYRYANPKREEDGVRLAPLPARPIEKGIAGAGLLARIIIDKFVDHLPFYRQRRRFRRLGYDIPASTLEGWFARACDLLGVLYDVLVSEVMGAAYLQADETPVRVLDPRKKGGTHRGYHWIYHAPRKKLAFFDYQPGRSRAGPEKILKNYQGWLQTDGYKVYDKFGEEPGIRLAGCMAHARRYFEKALKAYPEQAGQMLVWIQRLYATERKAREAGLCPDKRLLLRKSESLPVFKLITGWLIEQQENPDFVPKDSLGTATNYLLQRIDHLSRYIEDGNLEIDNNLAENLIRPIAIGRKNYLFVGSHKGGQRAATIYSLMASCKLNDIDPFVYLRDVLKRLPQMNIQELDQLLPGNWTPKS